MKYSKERNVFIFPGQGSQYNKMGEKLYSKYNFAKKTFQLANEILEYDIKKICCSDNKKKINNTRFTQPAIFIYSYIVDYILKEEGFSPSAVAGHSLGEISGLVSCNSLSFEDALSIIKIRADVMSNLGKEKPGKMAAIINSDIYKVQNLINDMTGIICIANINSYNQIIISGEESAINQFIELSKSYNIKRVILLNVSGAFHSPLMKKAKNILKNVINSVEFNDAKIPIYQNIMPKKTYLAKDIKSNLINQIDSPVKWLETILKLKSDGYQSFIEAGPKEILTKLNKNIISKFNFYSFESTKFYD